MYATPEGKIEIEVPVSYTKWGRVTLTFDSVEEMYEKLRDKEYVESMPLSDNDVYVDESYQVDFDCLDEMILAFRGEV